jgi:hypothetical protein
MSAAFRPGPSHGIGVEVRQSAEIGSDAFLPSQYYGERRASVCSEGERRLLLAVLRTAITDYLRAADSQTRLGRRQCSEVGAWFSNKSPAPTILAYEDICESLGIDPDRLRRWLWSRGSHSTVPRLRSQPVFAANRPARAAR